jgi:hypothetical protein
VGQRFVVQAVSGVYGGCALPVAWGLRPAGAQRAGRRAWRRRRRVRRPAIPPGWTVSVWADRGV